MENLVVGEDYIKYGEIGSANKILLVAKVLRCQKDPTLL